MFLKSSRIGAAPHHSHHTTAPLKQSTFNLLRTKPTVRDEMANAGFIIPPQRFSCLVRMLRKASPLTLRSCVHFLGQHGS